MYLRSIVFDYKESNKDNQESQKMKKSKITEN